MKSELEVPILPEQQSWIAWMRNSFPLGKFEISLIFTIGYLFFLLVSAYLTMWTRMVFWVIYLISTSPELGCFLIYYFDLLPEEVEQAEEDEQELPQMPIDNIAESLVINMPTKPVPPEEQFAEELLLVQSVLGTEEQEIVTKDEFLFEACYKISLLPKSQRDEQAAFIAEAHRLIQ